jgi:hypothetical protein
MRLEITCDWPVQPNGSADRLYPASSASTEDRNLNTPDPTLEPSTTGLQLDDLRLLHHWTVKTAKELHPPFSQKLRLWQEAVVDLGFQYPFLLHAILGIAAVHKCLSEPHADNRQLLALADSHVNRSLETYRKLLESPTLETAPATFMVSSLSVANISLQ